MSVVKKIIGHAFLFSAINLSVIGVSRQEAFFSLLSTIYPYDEINHRYNLVLFALNICIGLIFVSSIIKNADEQMLMNNYILVRTSRKKAFLIGILRNLKTISLVFFIKIFIDLLFSQINKTENLSIAVWTEVSTFLTLLIWALFIYIMLQKHISVKWTYFILLFSMIIFQYFSAYVSFFTLFVFGSPYIKASPMRWLMLKFVLIIILFFVNIIISTKYEQLNIKNEC
ncbi:MAG: hypothetical protein Q4E28_03005 [Clostridia bacterium]|nr:hypothetical protein [Clostridia bacterium]